MLAASWAANGVPLLAAAVSLVALLVTALWVHRSRIAGDPVWPPELGRETPAVANLVTHHFMCTADAVAATLLDLAARGVFHIDEMPGGTFEVRSTRHVPHGLTRYEQQVYDTVQRSCANGMVPVEVLTRELRHQPRAWMEDFRDAVIRDAASQRLIVDRWTINTINVVALIAMAVGGVSIILVGSSSISPGIALAMVACISLLLLALWWVSDTLWQKGQQRGRVAGRAAAARWLGIRQQLERDATFEALPPSAVVIWKRYLAYGVALGAAPAAAASLPLGKDDGRIAWSPRGGHWHRVRITYQRFFPPAWGRDPTVALIEGIVAAALAGWLLIVLRRSGPPYPSPPFSDEAARWIGDIEPLLWVAATFLGLWAVAVLFRAIRSLRRCDPIEGVALRIRDRGRVSFIAIDDGSRARIRACRIPSSILTMAEEGDRVRVWSSRDLGYVTRIELPDVDDRERRRRRRDGEG